MVTFYTQISSVATSIIFCNIYKIFKFKFKFKISKSFRLRIYLIINYNVLSLSLSFSKFFKYYNIL